MQEHHVLITKNLMKTYKQGEVYIYAVNRVNMTIPSAAFSAIIGPSGSGKSTLLHLLGGLDNPSGGEVWVRTDDGEEKNLYAMTPQELTRFRGKHFGFVFQNYELLPIMTAMENILLPCIYGGNEFDEKWFGQLTEILGLKNRLHHLPAEMSGGEQQRVAMARALIHRPRILFADEPTGNLDSENASVLLELLFYMRDRFRQTVVMVTHDTALSQRADCLFRIHDGQLR